MPGPLPNPQARRRNAPTVPTTELPAEGRKGRPPKCPYALGKAGATWWKWAWSLPQATRWDKGTLFVVGRRAMLEDELATCELIDGLDLSDLLAGADEEAVRRVEWALATLKRSATGSVAVMKEMRELDNRLGLNPKALADLRWVIAEADAQPAAATPRARAKTGTRRTGSGARLRAV